MAKAKILVVDDEPDIRELVAVNLAPAGYEVVACGTGEEAIEQARSGRPDLVVLDLMLPGMDGLEVCRRLKAAEHTRSIPILMLTAKADETDIVVGLELGAEDYVTKPFSGKVLLARVRKILQRASAPLEQCRTIRIRDLVIDPARHEVAVAGRPVHLTPTEFNVLRVLAGRPGLVFTRSRIVESLHDGDYVVTDRAVDVQVAALRRKLGSYGKFIETVRGVGYRFKD